MENYIDDRVYEQATGHAKSLKLKMLNELKKSVCKIKKTQFDYTGTGFFLKIQAELNDLYFLVTAHHLISEEYVMENKSIEIIPENKTLKRIIKLDRKDRTIICLSKQDITAIELIDKDDIKNNVKFLTYDLTSKPDCNDYKDKDIFSLHYPYGIDLECSSGKILIVKSPKQFEFQHSLDTEKGSSGAPIMIEDNITGDPKVMGVHTSGLISTNNNIGTFIGELINEINKPKPNK